MINSIDRRPNRKAGHVSETRIYFRQTFRLAWELVGKGLPATASNEVTYERLYAVELVRSANVGFFAMVNDRDAFLRRHGFESAGSQGAVSFGLLTALKDLSHSRGTLVTQLITLLQHEAYVLSLVDNVRHADAGNAVI